MSTVKLITPYNKQLHARLEALPVRVLITPGPINYSTIARKIFDPYKGKLVIFGELTQGLLPVDRHAYKTAEEVNRASIDDIVYRVMHNSSTRTYSGNGVSYYDVYKIWYECETLVPVRKYVPKLAMRQFKTTDARGLAPWDGETIGEMTEADDDYQRILSADLSYPIIMRRGGLLVDGNHRLIKCLLTGRKYIDVITIPGPKLRKCKIEGDVDTYGDMF